MESLLTQSTSTYTDYPFDQIDELDNEPCAFVGLSTFSGFRMTNSYRSSIWIGYQYGVPFYTQRNHEKWQAKKAGLKQYNYFWDVRELLETMGAKYPHPILYLPSKHAIRSMETNVAYARKDVDLSNLRYMLRTYAPQFRWYNDQAPPFCLLREQCWKWNREILKNVGEKSYHDYSDWSDL